MASKKAAAKRPVILVDGSSYLFRAYFAMPELTTSDGRHTGAVRGVIAMIRKLAKDYADSTVAVVFDAPGKTFRDELYGEYKANRESMPDDLREQIEPIHDTVISTSDKDMAQLVTDHVTLVNTMTDTAMDREGVVDKFGVAPEHIIDYLALMGDSVDNIPGVPKVGPKTAAKWLNEFGSLDEIMARADEIKGKVGENLRDTLQQLPLSRELTTIKCDVSLEQNLEDLNASPPDEAALRQLFADLEFKTWLAELDDGEASAEPAAAVQQAEYECITDLERLRAWTAKLADAGTFAVDTETTSIDYMQAELVGFSFACSSGEAAYLPVAHDYDGAPVQIGLDEALAELRPLLENEDITKVGQNLKYDISVLARHGVDLAGPIYVQPKNWR